MSAPARAAPAAAKVCAPTAAELAKEAGLSPAELLARYLESKGTPAPRIALLMRYADEILKNVEP